MRESPDVISVTLKGINFYSFRSLKSIQCRKYEIVTISLMSSIWRLIRPTQDKSSDLSRLNFIMIHETFISKVISSIVPIPCSFSSAVSELMDLKIEIENRVIR